MNMRAKFQVSGVEKVGDGEKLTFHAVAKNGYPADGSDDDNTYAKWSPSAHCDIMVMNPALHGQFKPGDKFYVDFTRAPDPAPEAAAAPAAQPAPAADEAVAA